METKIELETWMYAIVLNPGKNEQLLGQTNHKKKISYIPTFESRIDARKNTNLFHTDGNNYEIQAIIYEDIAKYASNNRFLIFIIDENGDIKNRIIP